MPAAPLRTTVPPVNGSALRAANGVARTWRMRQWPNDPTVAHLIFTDHQRTPTTDDLVDAVDHARARGARAVRTSALFPDAAEVTRAAGFTSIDRLALLRLDLDDVDLDVTETRHDIRPLQVWHHRLAAEIDRRAFGPMWGNDAASLRDIRRATPIHRARLVRDRGSVVGFAISGAAVDNGYLQRIAVDPDAHRRGVARDLVVDALRWMRADRREQCLVNTGVDNQAALALYDGFGFVRLADELTIAERRFTE